MQTPTPLNLEARQFPFPLNVYAELLQLQTGHIDSLHYGLFETADEPVAAAQARSTTWLFQQLPPAPLKLLEVGIGLSTTLSKLVQAGYQVTGLTPDPAQVRIAAERCPGTQVVHSTFEQYQTDQQYDLILFQESSQYIPTAELWQQIDRLLAPQGRVLVLDEFARDTHIAGLHALTTFLDTAAAHGYSLIKNHDHSTAAAHTVSYLQRTVAQLRPQLLATLPIDDAMLDHLQTANQRYQHHYAQGEYQYRYLEFTRPSPVQAA
ncbi:hypothetical protein GCM10007907_07140 [Chitinimonas prasina]|uniref:Methyltransferase type 11 domain-containing protein n=1 Tax=Chitinimonas prasina TaxID=1434937 RepID=A0ABQ5YG86_9NEIS|nr:methyltransferase domain-containing protein [Chitinimonas prasina]GLR11924.1 hypothetical protein GCM10007907_07140 [Chitinimonas prasina]